jgi:hypothetical protein
MGFETPVMLWGLLVAGLPVAIHLIERRRARVLPFASIEFLLGGDARQARRLRIQQWLLLALRVALLAALALAFAKPYATPDSGPAVSSAQPSAVVLLLDNSASMAARDANGERLLDVVLDAARERVEAGGPLARFGVVTLSRPARALTTSLSGDQAEILRILDEVHLSERGADTSEALSEAQRLFSDAVEEAKVLWIGSDRAHHAWAGAPRFESTTGESGGGWIEVASLERVEILRNLSVDGVTPTPGAGPSGETSFEVMISNHGDESAPAEVRVRIGELVSAVSLEIPAGGEESATLYMALEVDLAARHGVVEVTSPGDQLDADDLLFFDLSESRALRIAVVNGSPRSVPWLDEVFFVRAGLAARQDGGERWSANHVPVEELTNGLLVHTDVVILANVGALADSQTLALRRFVTEGGGLFIAVGDQMSANSNVSYGGLLPAPIRTLKRRDTRSRERSADEQTQGLTLEQRDHPILRAFGADGLETLTRARARTLALLNDQRRPGVEILARWAQGEPALLELAMGEGRVLLLTTSLDRDGSDLVLRTSFVPFLQRTVEYLAGRFDGEHQTDLEIGEPLLVEAPAGQGPLVLTGPQDLELEIEAPRRRPGEPDLCDIGVLERAGTYSLSRRDAPLDMKNFSLNVDRAESLLTYYGSEELSERLQPNGRELKITTSETGSAGDAGGRRQDHGEPLWPIALLALFALLIGESWFALRSG